MKANRLVRIAAGGSVILIFLFGFSEVQLRTGTTSAPNKELQELVTKTKVTETALLKEQQRVSVLESSVGVLSQKTAENAGGLLHHFQSCMSDGVFLAQDIVGHDITVANAPTSVRSCCDTCARDEECEGWTFAGQEGGHCYLKRATAPRRPSAGAVSGSRSCCDAFNEDPTKHRLCEDMFDCLQLDFFVIGFAKAGTTAFDNVLNLLSDDIGTHPDEWPFLHFKLTPERYAKQWERRVRDLDTSLSSLTTRVKGVRNPAQAWHKNEMAYLARTHPKTKIIILLRDPVTWLRSFFNYRVREVHEVPFHDTIPNFTDIVHDHPDAGGKWECPNKWENCSCWRCAKLYFEHFI